MKTKKANPHQVDAVVKCSNCRWHSKFTNPTPFEIDLGLNMGCTKPGWEGYTKDKEPFCGGDFFVVI